MLTKVNPSEEFYTAPQLAELLGVSRVTVFKRIKSGAIKAIKIGRVFAVPKKDWFYILSGELSKEQKKIIEEAVNITTSEYGGTITMLGNS